MVADINATITGGTAYATPATADLPNRVRIRTTSSLGASSTILIGAPSNNANATLGLAAATYTGYGRCNDSWTQVTGTKQELADKIETELNAVGWATISGSGTTNLLMESAMSPPGQNLKIRARIKGTNTNCVSISIEAVSGTPAGTNGTNNGAMLLPAAGKVWYFIANKYQAFIMVPNTAIAARGFAAFGVVQLPTHMQGVTTQAAWLQGSAVNDTDATNRANWRGGLVSATSASTTPNIQTIYNASLLQDLGNTSNQSSFGLLALLHMGNYVNVNTSGAAGSTFKDLSLFEWDAWIMWGDSSINTTVSYLRGQLWDAFCISGSFTGDTTFTLPSPDSHNCIVITHNNGGTTAIQPAGSLCVAVP